MTGRYFKLQTPRATYLNPKQVENGLFSGIIKDLESKLLKNFELEQNQTSAKALKRPKRGITDIVVPILGEVLKENKRITEIVPKQGEVVKSNKRINEQPIQKETADATIKVPKIVQESTETEASIKPPAKVIEPERKTLGMIKLPLPKIYVTKSAPKGKVFVQPAKPTVSTPAVKPSKPAVPKPVTQPVKSTVPPPVVQPAKPTVPASVVQPKSNVEIVRISEEFKEYPALYERAKILDNAPLNMRLLSELSIEKIRIDEERTKSKRPIGDYMTLKEILPNIKLKYQEDIGRFSFEIDDEKVSHIGLSSQIAYLLGFEEDAKIRNGDLASFSCDLRGGVSHLCVYINGVIENIIVGDKLASLLQIVAVGGKPGDVVEKKYDSPLFSKIATREIDEIEIEIKTLENRLVPFDYGN